MAFPGGYTGKILKADLTSGVLSELSPNEATLRKYIGGTGLGAHLLYQSVDPGIDWSSPENIMVWASGPLGGTAISGSGTFSVVTKGALTNGATSTQANGFFGTCLKTSGFDAVIIEGISKDWVYIHIHDGVAELKSADFLLGKDTWETEDAIKEKIGASEHGASVFSIGPAGENLVRFACIVGDRGHVAAHNGVGAVMGMKKLKAIVAVRGKKPVPVTDREKLSAISKEIVTYAKSLEHNEYVWGTSMLYGGMMRMNMLPIKNLTTIEFPEYHYFTGIEYRPRLEMKRSPCWGCQAHHCHTVKILEGPYAGYIADEPEYEGLAAWGSCIGQTDVNAAIMLNNEADKLGVDTNEAGWLVAMLMECYERGIISKEDTDGLELTWGNIKAARELLYKIAYRKGFGDILAEGIMRASHKIGGEAPDIGVYVKKGSVPRSHDHRASWYELFDTVTSSTGTVETGHVSVVDSFSPQDVSTRIAESKGARYFKDSLGICLQSTGTYQTRSGKDPGFENLIAALNAATGWDFTVEEAYKVGLRAANLLRLFNIRAGITPEMEAPSTRYGSTPAEGIAKGKSIMQHLDEMLNNFYTLMGWDSETGKPLPETLKELDLDHIIPDL
jgi:aldehyde:ferredoxin oxidoreductase